LSGYRAADAGNNDCSFDVGLEMVPLRQQHAKPESNDFGM
jgi:hypothetical protein